MQEIDMKNLQFKKIIIQNKAHLQFIVIKNIVLLQNSF